MSKKEEDRITRAGLQAFANKCKETFDKSPDIKSLTYNTEYIEYTIPAIEMASSYYIQGVAFLITDPNDDLLLEQSKTTSYAGFNAWVNPNDLQRSAVLSTGDIAIQSAYAQCNLGALIIVLKLSSGCSIFTTSAHEYQSDGNIKGCTVTHNAVSGITESFYTKLQTSVESTESTATTFNVIDANNDTIEYTTGNIYNSILLAGKLSHKLKFVLPASNTQISSYETDLSINLNEDEDYTVVYVQDASSTNNNNVNALYDRVEVRRGLIISGKTAELLVASDTALGYIKTGFKPTAYNQYKVQLNDEHLAYVELPTGLLTYKGSVDSYELLPKEKNNNGDVYSVKDSFGEEYVWLVKDSGDGVWEYLGEKFVLKDVYWTKPVDADENWTGKLLQNAPTLSLTRPTSSANGSILIGSTSIGIEKDSTVTENSNDILVSKAYVDALDKAISDSIPTVPIKSIYVGETQQSPDTDGKVTLTYPEVPIKAVQIDGTNLVANEDGAVNIKSSQYFADNLEYESDATLDIGNFITQQNPYPNHYYEKTVLIYNTSENDITLGLPTVSSVAIIPMTSFPLTVGGHKYAEIVATYYPAKGEKPAILTFNGGVLVQV